MAAVITGLVLSVLACAIQAAPGRLRTTGQQVVDYLVKVQGVPTKIKILIGTSQIIAPNDRTAPPTNPRGRAKSRQHRSAKHLSCAFDHIAPPFESHCMAYLQSQASIKSQPAWTVSMASSCRRKFVHSCPCYKSLSRLVSTEFLLRVSGRTATTRF